MADTPEAPEVIDVFLCHNSADKPWVEKLAEQIESETFDGTSQGRHLKVFFDKWDIDLGQNFIQRINDGLSKARFVVVVISPEFLTSGWTGFEWTHVVSQDPMNVRARLIPLFLREHSLNGNETCDLPAPFRALNWLDFRHDADFKNTYLRFIRKVRGLLPARGQKRQPLANLAAPSATVPEARTAATPDRVNDLILSNLLPVSDLPLTVWSAPTTARLPKDVWSAIENPLPFILREKRLYAFADLAHPKAPFGDITGKTDIKGESMTVWRANSVKWAWFIDLMHRALREHLGKMGIKEAKSHRFFFRGNKDGTSRQQKNGNDPLREVAAKKINSANGSVFWVHHGAELRFHTLGDGVFLGVEPCYVFTSDGRTPLTGPRVTPLSMKWGGKERNAAILRHVIFWARTIGKSKPRIQIQTGAKPITISGLPALSRTTFGIEFDHIALRTLMAQIDDELDEVAKSLEGVSFATANTVPPSDEDEHE